MKKVIIRKNKFDTVYLDEINNKSIYVCIFRDNKYILCACEGTPSYRWIRLIDSPMALSNWFTSSILAIKYMIETIEAEVYEAKDINEALEFFQIKK